MDGVERFRLKVSDEVNPLRSPADGIGARRRRPPREVQSECAVISLPPRCEFRKGQLFRFSRFDPVMRVFGREGRFAFNAPVRFPDGDLAPVWDVDIDSDGSMLAAAADYEKKRLRSGPA